MTDSFDNRSIFPSAEEDARTARRLAESAQTSSPSYNLAYTDEAFLMRDDLRAVRLQLEWLKPDMVQQENEIDATVVIFGGTRFPSSEVAQERLQVAEHEASLQPEDPGLARKVEIAKRVQHNSRYYDEARKLAHMITTECGSGAGARYVVVTGGGPGIMEAANRGAAEAGGISVGFNVALPFEQQPNPFVTPELCFQFHYFAIRKMHFLKRARALIACPGGLGTLDELFETLTLIQTRKIKPIPVMLLGSDYWRRLINFDLLVEEGAIDEADLSLFEFVDSAAEAWHRIKAFWKHE